MKCAVIGVGSMGQHHARNYFEIKSAQLVAVSDKNPKVGKRVARTYNCKFYQDYRQMLKKEDFEAVSVATSTSTHYSIVLDCLKAKKHVLVEKPIASSISEARKLIDEAKKNHVILSVGHIERFNPAVQKLKSMIDKGMLGEIKSLVFQRVGLTPIRVKDVNVVEDIGIHDIDLANFFLNSLPNKISAFGGKALINQQEDYADILLNYPSAAVHIQTNWITPLKIRRLMIAGTKGYVELDLINQNLDFYRHHYTQKYNNFGDFVIKFERKSQKRKIPVKKQEPLREELKSFLQSVKLRRHAKVSGEDGLSALKIALDISKMIKSK